MIVSTSSDLVSDRAGVCSVLLGAVIKWRCFMHNEISSNKMSFISVLFVPFWVISICISACIRSLEYQIITIQAIVNVTQRKIKLNTE